MSGRYVGTQWDDNANTRAVKRKVIFDWASSYDVNDNMQVFGRVENLFGRDYESSRGYAGTERAFFGGVKGTF